MVRFSFFGTGYYLLPVLQTTGQDWSKTGKLEVVPYVVVEILEPIANLGFHDRSQPWPLKTLLTTGNPVQNVF